jgi:threonine dehydrogenase-like Zn-dependent dehydrogenase
MRVPRFLGDGRIVFIDKPVPQPGPGQLLLAVKANALCGSERGQFYGGSSVTPGHEAAGVVVAAGSDTSTPIGALGPVFLMDFCGRCRSCLAGATNQCFAKRADYGFTHDGGYAPFELVNENVFFAADADLTGPEAILLLDIMGTGGHCLDRLRLVRPEIESLLITGAGPIGLGVLVMAKIMLGEAVPVAITDVVPYRLDLASSLGGLPIDIAHASLPDALDSLGIPRPDAAVDTSGREAARRAAIDVLAQRGVLVCVGHGESVTLDVSRDLISTERAVVGSEYFRYDEFPRNLALLRKHRAYLSRIVTHRFPVAEIQRAFEVFFAGNTGEVVVEQ